MATSRTTSQQISSPYYDPTRADSSSVDPRYVMKGIDFSLPLKERVIEYQKNFLEDPNFDGFDAYALRNNVRCISVTPTRTEWELDILPHLCNKGGKLHGGAAATIMDNLTTTALVAGARPGFMDVGHVSRNINMTYLRPVLEGATVRVVCELVSGGRTLVNMRGEIIMDGKVCVTCLHDKVFLRPPPESSKL
ncbi:uncharacterized protein Z520_07238 [Fonsecaea multimorphosa CBS 102226]|uniref:Thioesterase domain-containing protein n=1 Tax=Fonsecaea multimorphosa CBS 102226 TaxID=1442371 RepID=A0A0D2K251_9EURO|nr:uncharacterized protein Z520_07238 [Fonsecaea multimorphosa CBS 102226]KIX97124.1 hypothetical protein Z520_07238 [Fonsecaea multimorphosa CBS 102226]OAL22899.1 hypothetical protein AYO22_06807 [Fonsecaea multimorphosa]